MINCLVRNLSLTSNWSVVSRSKSRLRGDLTKSLYAIVVNGTSIPRTIVTRLLCLHSVVVTTSPTSASRKARKSAQKRHDVCANYIGLISMVAPQPGSGKVPHQKLPSPFYQVSSSKSFLLQHLLRSRALLCIGHWTWQTYSHCCSSPLPCTLLGAVFKPTQRVTPLWILRVSINSPLRLLPILRTFLVPVISRTIWIFSWPGKSPLSELYSDHNPVLLKIIFANIRSIPIFSKTDWLFLSYHLEKSNFRYNQINSPVNLDSALDDITSNINSSTQKATTTFSKPILHPDLTHDLIALIKSKNKTLRRLQGNSSPALNILRNSL